MSLRKMCQPILTTSDLDDRRIDYYAAESIRRGVLELKGNRLIGQFEVLKNETLDGVKDTAKRTHINGYEHMLTATKVDSAFKNIEKY